ncbi:exodeoxyribonuclease X C-terminal domain-containing protein [Cryobacterium zhongshanensis]|uniref:Exodeoxyribonuclease X-like C-terminal domain-containing protein n=1 Tax=Cryobacterium zhongshanensis TaxID=2928153 RepID=A0AA41QZI4_9MICO|nr:hypothetical protein [Cryobacterium zhongshanensis]MCI4659674.1 hypothetical protein [Cryobacterium zhongshanensis]
MSEIVRVEDPPMIPFGKHAGKSAAEVMATDPAYVQWMLAQPWFQEKNPTLVQFFVHGSVASLGAAGVEPAETPEHNVLQAKFTQDAYCFAAAAMFSAGQKIRTVAEVQKEGEQLAGPALESCVQSFHPTIADRHFELHAWDVQFSFTGAYSEMGTSMEPVCSCEPGLLPEVPREPKRPGYEADPETKAEHGRLQSARHDASQDHSRVLRMNEDREKARFNPYGYLGSWQQTAAFDTYVKATQHELNCPRSSLAYFRAWPFYDECLVTSTPRRFGLELKPTMGDDFPAVLRQVLGYLNRPGVGGAPSLAAVVVGEFRSASVPWHLVKKQFWESGVLLVREAELDALVEKHAHDWGIDLSAAAADFTISFTDQL